VLQVEERAQRAKAGASKLGGTRGGSGSGGATWRGEEGPAGAGKRWARVLEGTWREVERHGAAGAWEHGRQRCGVGRREKQREEELEVEDRDLCAILQKCRDSTVKLG
jgi:hypothetical protein